MKIKVNRDSVCLGDDIDDHTKEYQINDNSTYEDLFKLLLKDHYFPSISGNNVVWVLTSDISDCIFSYFTRTNKFSPGLSTNSLYQICYESSRPAEKLYLKYYTTPLKWKEEIYSLYHGNEYAMWRDGWTEEIKYCDYVMALGLE